MADEPKPTSIRLPGELLDQIGDLADTLDRPRSWVIEQACRVYLDRKNSLPEIDWSASDEGGSCGFGYTVTLHFNIPATAYADGAVYLLRDDLIERLSFMGAREIWTEVQGVRPLELEESAVLGYHAFMRGEEHPWAKVIDPGEDEGSSGHLCGGCRHGRPECECLLPVTTELREWTPPPTNVTYNIIGVDAEKVMEEVRKRDHRLRYRLADTGAPITPEEWATSWAVSSDDPWPDPPVHESMGLVPDDCTCDPKRNDGCSSCP